jgi:L-alanine-DL-glutamate epimerase-like enolase superfamily enzyme
MVLVLMLSLCGVVGSKWNVDVWVLDLPLAERFTIARDSYDVASNVFVSVAYDGVMGFGEASPDERWGESIDSVAAQLREVPLDQLAGPFDLEAVLQLLGPGAARGALDIALHDLAGKLAGISVGHLLGIGDRSPPPTSVTVSIAELDHMVERARRLGDHPVLKVKVGFDGDVEAVHAVRDVYPGRIRIDANEGWDPETAIDRLGKLETLEIELCEQPIRAGDHEALRAVTQATSIPVFADEDVSTSEDVASLEGSVDGVNLKLRKAGGIRATVAAIATARAHGLGVMLGCDLESGVAATAQAHVAPLVDHADIDGPLLLARDPFPGVGHARGALIRPHGPGLGLRRNPTR